MRHLRLLASACALAIPIAVAADAPPSSFELQPGVRIRLATRAEGARLITEPDEYLAAVTAADRALEVGRTGEVSQEELLAFLRDLPMDWTAEETRAAASAVAGVAKDLGDLRPPFPAEMVLVKLRSTSVGPYTRGKAVYLPIADVGSAVALRGLLAHELFHVLSRNAPALRERLYGGIGYRRCGPLALPPALARLHYSNPDAPTLDWCTDLEVDGATVAAFPYWYAPSVGADRLQFRMVIARQQGERWAPVEKDGAPWLVDPRPLPSFWKRIGRNTSYVEHPEEILADNFAQILGGARKVRNPEIHALIEAALPRAGGGT